MFSASLVNSFMKFSNRRMIGVAFFSDTSDYALILKSLLYQFAAYFPEVQNDILNCIREFTDSREEWTVLNIFEKLLLKSLNSLKLSRNKTDETMDNLLIVLDGINCSTNQVEMLSLFDSAIRLLPSWVKFFITSRPEPDIDTALDSFSFTIDENDMRNIEDLVYFAANLLVEIELPFDVGFDIVLESLLLKSNGNISKLKKIGEELRKIKVPATVEDLVSVVNLIT